jgi:dihydrofolate reductase
MRKLKYHVATTVDGFIARADDSFDCFPQEGEHIADYLSSLASYHTVLMGRRTYEVGLRVGVTDPYPQLESYVFSRSLKESPSPRVKLISEDAAPFVGRLKEQEGGEIYLCGGGALAAALFAEGLIDEVLLKVNPLLLGAGIPVTSGLRGVTNLELLSSKVYRNGVLLLHYEVVR